MSISRIEFGKPHVSERELTNACIDYLERLQIPYLDFRRNTGLLIRDKAGGFRFGKPRLSQKGKPDLILCWRGRFVAVEFKTRTGKVSVDQKTWLDHCEFHNGVVLIPRSVDEFIKKLGSIDIGRIPT